MQNVISRSLLEMPESVIKKHTYEKIVSFGPYHYDYHNISTITGSQRHVNMRVFQHQVPSARTQALLKD